MYFDVTNLYGYSMTDYLPHGNFRWLNNDEILNWSMDKECIENGYILEVDLIYPIDLRDEHSELPLAPEHFNGKLTPNLYSKKNYRLRLENLKFYLSKGLKLDKIHKILEFSQSKWLKSYIDTNTNLRKQSTDESAKIFYKLVVFLFIYIDE
jgi:hypothetical protein